MKDNKVDREEALKKLLESVYDFAMSAHNASCQCDHCKQLRAAREKVNLLSQGKGNIET